MSGSKRQRELARAKYERQQARRMTQAQRRKARQRIIAAAVVAALVLGSVAWILISRQAAEPDALPEAPAASAVPSQPAPSEAAPSGAPAATPTADPAASAEPGASAEASDPALGEPAVLDCRPPGTVRPDDLTFEAAPTEASAAGMTLTTNCGDIVIAFDPKAPATVASMAFLTEQGFYDNTQCHRLTTQGLYVLQCGDASGTGAGGPGYALPEENLPAAAENNYPAGTVAMANSGPGTSGSQFFIVYQDTTLPADYTVFGTVTSGLDMVQEVASVGVADGSGDGTPRQPVFIESATVQPNE